MSTLIRHLRNIHTTYQEVIDNIRHQRAIEMLANPKRRTSDIAGELGYRDTTSFVHAFRRWHGVTPGVYRHGVVSDAKSV